MHIKVKNLSGESITNEEKVDPLTWEYVLNTEDHAYIFLGDDSEKKLFAKFQNVSSYRKALSTILSFLDTEIKKIQTRLNNSAITINHNFIETCKHVRDPISIILPNLHNTQNHKEKIARVVKHLENSKTEDVATALLDVDRAITNLQTQISGLEILSGEYKPTVIEHEPHALIKNIMTPFIKSFEEKSINTFNNIRNETSNKSVVLVDYHILNWVFYHLLSNAVKYCKPNSDLKIWYDPNQQKISIEMRSLKVSDDEAQSIFKDGVRGKYAEKYDFSGEGLGMSFAKMGLEHIGCCISFIPHKNTEIVFEEKPYCKNVIEISL